RCTCFSADPYGRRLATSTLLPYTTLFRSSGGQRNPDAERPPCAAPRGGGLQKHLRVLRRNLPRGAGTSQAVRRHVAPAAAADDGDRKSTRLNSSHVKISYAVFCLKNKK